LNGKLDEIDGIQSVMSIINSIRRFLFHLPGKRFGYYRCILYFFTTIEHKYLLNNNYFYRAIPIFVIAGAGIEYLMITWRPFGVNFYEVYKRKQAKELAANRLKED